MADALGEHLLRYNQHFWGAGHARRPAREVAMGGGLGGSARGARAYLRSEISNISVMRSRSEYAAAADDYEVFIATRGNGGPTSCRSTETTSHSHFPCRSSSVTCSPKCWL